jgi:hypothetical protein
MLAQSHHFKDGVCYLQNNLWQIRRPADVFMAIFVALVKWNKFNGTSIFRSYLNSSVVQLEVEHTIYTYCKSIVYIWLCLAEESINEMIKTMTNTLPL